MKQLFYKLILFFACVPALAQTEVVFNEKYNAEKIGNMDVHINNIPLEIKESKDNNIYIDFKLVFNKYSKHEIDSVKNLIELDYKLLRDKFTLKIGSKEEVLQSRYHYEGSMFKEKEKELKKYFKEKIKFDFKRKTKNEIIEKYKTKNFFSKLSSMRKDFMEKKNIKSVEAFFIIRIPEKLTNGLKIQAEQCRLRFDSMEMINLELFASGGSLKIPKIKESKITCWDGLTFLGEIDKSIVDVNHTTLFIGGIKNSNLKSEAARIEIGEVGTYVDIKDYSSWFYLYNFSDKFKSVKFTGEYSKICFYKPENNYDVKAYGHSTVLKYGEIETKMKPNKNGENSLMFEMKGKLDEKYAGKIIFTIQNAKFNIPE